MKVGVFVEGQYTETWRNQDHDIVELPVARNAAGSAYDADLAARMVNGAATIARLADHPIDMFADVNGFGLGFVGDAPDGADLRIAHEAAKKPLFSHFVDSVPTVFGGLGWAEVWQALTSRFWIKAVADRAHVYELESLGVPQVVQLSASAPDLPYVTEPLDQSAMRPVVSYVGTRKRDCFATDGDIKASELLPATLAHAVRADMPGTAFFDAYHDLYEIAAAPAPDDDVRAKVRKVSEYFNAKKFFLAGLGLRERDRFVLFCHRKLGDVFRLMGTGWQEAYGLNCAPPPTGDAFVTHLRESAINLNFGDGATEQGLNRRHFEITAAGGFMLCHDQPDVGEHFDVGVECAVFRDEVDLLDKVRYYLEHHKERAAIALAGQKRTLSQHLHSHRVRALMEMAAGMMRPLPVNNARGVPAAPTVA